MITFQKRIAYAGDPTAIKTKVVTLSLDLPVFAYASAGAGDQDIARRDTSSTQTESITQPLDGKSYQLTVADAFVAGTDGASAALARQFFAAALQSSSADDLVVHGVMRYLVGDAEIGRQAVDFICVPSLVADAQPALEARASAFAKLSYIAINAQGFERLRKQLRFSPADDAVLLRAISVLTLFEENTPTLVESQPADFKKWLESATRRTAADGTKVFNAIKAAFNSLYDFPLTIPEVKLVSIAGTLTIVGPTGSTISAKDFLAYELSAECPYANRPGSANLSFRFNERVTVTGSAAPFSLTAGKELYRNDLASAVLVSVKGVDGSEIWSEEYSPDDASLAKLDIRVPLQRPTTLTAKEAGPDKSKKIRGRVLAFNRDCLLKDVLVLLQAKSAANAPWQVVGAATTDGSGNFSMPYPYGTYVEAQAVTSLAPQEAASVAIVATEGDETISDHFLYLLLREPECAPAPTDADCECESGTKPNRLPDYADLIGSDAYSQDIGGACVNLSKPNRTISEFRYQAVVRTSDPDVSNYSLQKIETGLSAIDVSMSLALASSASTLYTLTSQALTNARSALQAAGSVFSGYLVTALEAAWPHVVAVRDGLASTGAAVTGTVLADTLTHLDAVITIVTAHKTRTERDDIPGWPVEGDRLLDAASNLRSLVPLAIDTVGTTARFELVGGAAKTLRRPVALNNPISWQDAPDAKAVESLSQAVSVATGHILHYSAQFKADGYSLGDLIYSLPLAPGQKKEIVVFEASHTLVGAESQSLAQNERLAMGLVDERDITNQIAGSISETMRGSSSANTSGISAGFGTGGQGYGGTGAYGGSGSAVLGIAGGVANSNSTASQDSSRDMSQFFGEKLRQSIMQNAEGYRQLNASVVTTVQEGQRYGVTSEVVANHNHCHALTMMYFEVLRHYAIFQKLSSVEECVFVPFLMTRFTTENVAKWRDVLAPALLPMPSETYLQPFALMAGPGRSHPLARAFDADQRIKTHYANVDFPAGAYDEEPIRFLKGEMLLRVDLPRPKTRYDRIKSLPVTTRTETTREIDPLATAKQASYDAIAAGLTGGLSLLFSGPAGSNIQYNTKETQVQVKQAIFDAFMTLDANYESVPPAQCIRVTNFAPTSISFGGVTVPVSGLDFFQDGIADRDLWTRYARILGYSDVLKMLDYYFKGRLISEWDDIFYNDIAPLIFRKIVSSIAISEINTDFASETAYRGGERLIRLFVSGTTSKRRNQLPAQLALSVTSADIRALKDGVTLNVETLRISYSTAHYNGLLFSGSINDDLLDGTSLDIPESPDEKRNPRREDRYLAAKLLEHLNSNLEYYNKVLWYRLDPDRRFMLLDGFSIQVFDEAGSPIGSRSLASVVKNDLITVSGNSLVFSVAPGYRVSQSFIQQVADGQDAPSLLDHYQPLTPIEPYRISVPSRGVFAEAVQGVCNACEKIETERLQDWSKFPIGDEPTAIAPITTPTPVVTDWKAAFKDFATPIVNIQNAPTAPAPGAGLAGVSDLLGKSGVFKDITGLDANQQNVIRTYLSNQENAKAFAEMAKEMAMQNHNTQNSGKIMDSIKSAKDTGAINQTEYGALVKDHLQQQIDGGQTKKSEIDKERSTNATPLTKAAVDAAAQGREVKAQTTDSEGNTESVDIRGDGGTSSVLAEAAGVLPLQQTSQNDCWAVAATMMTLWKYPSDFSTVEDVLTAAGDKYLQLYRNDTGLKAADKQEFITNLGLIAEAPANYALQSYIDWVNTYGPLWITTDAVRATDVFSPHARILTRITGTGTPDGAGTQFTFIDPATGKEETQTFTDFITAFEQMVSENKGALFLQIVHFSEPVVAGEGGVKGALLKAVGGKALERSLDVLGDQVTKTLGAGKGDLTLPDNVTPVLEGTTADQYKPASSYSLAARRMTITLDDLVNSGPGDGLDGVIALEWLEVRYTGPIAPKTPKAMRDYIRSILFMKSISGMGTVSAGGAISSAKIDVSISNASVDEMGAPARIVALAVISISVEPKTPAGDTVNAVLRLELNPQAPASVTITYDKTRKDRFVVTPD